MIFRELKRVEDYREGLKYASEKHENMENRVEISFVRADLVEEDADRVHDSAAEKKRKACRSERAVH